MKAPFGVQVPGEFDGGIQMEISAAQPQTLAKNPMATTEQAFLRTELQRRQGQLQSALRAHSASQSLSALLTEVDAALARMHDGTYGKCEVCHEAIENDRLLADPLVRLCLDHLTYDEQRALEQDLARAATIQQALLPRSDFATAGWQVRYHYAPAGLVSGDYCDLLESRGGLLFLLGDVSGKGVAASMMMSHLHATFRSLADSDLPLGALVETANRIFAESTLADQYATLVVGRAWQDGTVEYVSAGHLPLLHLRANEARSQSATGIPVGMFKNAQFPVQRLHVSDGETLLLHTDGLNEARNAHGEEYGLQRVHTFAAKHYAASPEELISCCLSDVGDFSKGAKPADDLTLLAIRRAA
jgi:sigma-B regulation protein RsbU (phosphoserine phosphatase)